MFNICILKLNNKINIKNKKYDFILLKNRIKTLYL